MPIHLLPISTPHSTITRAQEYYTIVGRGKWHTAVTVAYNSLVRKYFAKNDNDRFSLKPNFHVIFIFPSYPRRFWFIFVLLPSFSVIFTTYHVFLQSTSINNWDFIKRGNACVGVSDTGRFDCARGVCPLQQRGGMGEPANRRDKFRIVKERLGIYVRTEVRLCYTKQLT